MRTYRPLLLLVFGATTAYSQSWEFTAKPPQEISRSASLKTDAGEIVALWRADGQPGDEIVTYHDFTEVGFRRIQYLYSGALNGSLMVRRVVHYSYKAEYKREPYYGPEEILYFPRSSNGHYELRSEHFKRIWFRAEVNDVGRVSVTAQAATP